MKKQTKPNPIRDVRLGGDSVPLLSVARVIDTLDPLQLAALTVTFANGRTLQPFRTGFEVEQL
jgi:hypothetical protein